MKSKSKGFTLVELLVVIAIIAMLLAILMPALSRVRTLAYQMICGTNQSGIGKAILLYSSENEQKYPEFGPGGEGGQYIARTAWAGFLDPYEWDERDNYTEYSGEDADTTVTASMYLLVKYADVNPSQFICSAQGATKFELDDYESQIAAANPAEDITECWDFGPRPDKHVSFAFNYPYSDYNPDGSSPPATPLMADTNPWMTANPLGSAPTTTVWTPAGTPNTMEDPQHIDYSDAAQTSYYKLGNSASHGLEGQNVLFNDMHVKFQKTPNVGIEQDNIYTIWDLTTSIAPRKRQKGLVVSAYIDDTCSDCPEDEGDALLIQW